MLSEDDVLKNEQPELGKVVGQCVILIQLTFTVQFEQFTTTAQYEAGTMVGKYGLARQDRVMVKQLTSLAWFVFTNFQ